MTPNDKLLFDHLDRRRPEDWETASELVAKLIYGMRPDLIRYVASFGRLDDVEKFVDEIIWAAFETFRDQYLGKPVRMPFSNEYADRVEDLLKGWLLAMIGKPFAGTRSGMITNAIRKEKAEKKARATAEVESALEPDASDAEKYFNVEEARANVEDVLRKLSPKKEFVFRIHTGLHDQQRLSSDSVVQIARSSRLNKTSCKYIKSIAKGILDDGHTSLTLDQSTTGRLVAIKERQVRKIVSDARAALMSARLNT